MGRPAYRYDDLLADVVLSAPGCPSHLAKLALRRAARDLCVRSGVWRNWITVSAVAEVRAYSLSSQWDAEIDSVQEVYIDGSPVIKSGYRLDEGYKLVFLDGYQPTAATGVSDFSNASTYAVNDKVRYSAKFWKCVVAVGTAGAWDEDDWREDDETGIWVRCVLRPSFNAEELPEWIMEQYAKGIASGAASLLLSQRGRPWYDPQQSAKAESDFYSVVNRACWKGRQLACHDSAGSYVDYSMDVGA